MAIPSEPNSPTTDAPPHHAELAHTAAAAVCAMTVAPLVWSLAAVSIEPGTRSWRWGVYGLLLTGITYLVLLAQRHLNEAWRGADGSRAAVWRTVAAISSELLIVGAMAALLVRGEASRALLAGLGDALVALAVASGTSALVTLGSWWTERRISSGAKPKQSQRPRPGLLSVVLAAGIIAGFVWIECRSLPADHQSLRAPDTTISRDHQRDE
jgi:hypothetical protein